jgi:hypothetical protein
MTSEPWCKIRFRSPLRRSGCDNPYDRKRHRYLRTQGKAYGVLHLRSNRPVSGHTTASIEHTTEAQHVGVVNL